MTWLLQPGVSPRTWLACLTMRSTPRTLRGRYSRRVCTEVRISRLPVLVHKEAVDGSDAAIPSGVAAADQAGRSTKERKERGASPKDLRHALLHADISHGSMRADAVYDPAYENQQ